MEYMTIKQVAEVMHLHPNTVYRYVKNGSLPSSKVGTTIRINKDDLRSVLNK